MDITKNNKPQVDNDAIVALVGLAQEGDLSARNKVMILMEYSVNYMCINASNPKVKAEEFKSYAIEALDVAIKNYDASKGVKFTSYAAACIKNSFYKCRNNLISIPRTAMKKRRKMLDAGDDIREFDNVLNVASISTSEMEVYADVNCIIDNNTNIVDKITLEQFFSYFDKRDALVIQDWLESVIYGEVNSNFSLKSWLRNHGYSRNQIKYLREKYDLLKELLEMS